MMQESLVNASKAFNGEDLQGTDKSRFTLEEVLEGRSRRKVLKNLNRIATAYEGPVAKKYDYRYASMDPHEVGQREMDAAGLTESEIARIALSEIDPAMIQASSAGRIRQSAEILLAARSIAMQCHEYTLRADT